jgi:hypothetical protein
MKRYTRAEHARARHMFLHHQKAGALKPPPGIMSSYANGTTLSLSESVTRYEHYPDARRALRRGE